jgi:hypothetical protein
MEFDSWEGLSGIQNEPMMSRGIEAAKKNETD